MANPPTNKRLMTSDQIRRAIEHRKTLRQIRLRDAPVDLDQAIATNPVFRGAKLSGYEDPQTRNLIAILQAHMNSGTLSFAKVLPVILRLKGTPFTLNDHFPFEPLFHTRMPEALIVVAGRQVGKSASITAQGVVQTACIPHFSTLFVTPLFEQTRRLSQNYMRPFIETSPVRSLLRGSSVSSNVLQRTFINESTMYFSFAYLDAERTRGIPADKNCLAAGSLIELQDGRQIPIEQVDPGDIVVSARENGDLTTDTVTEKICQGTQAVFEVTFSNGAVVRCTSDERFRLENGNWSRLSDHASSKLVVRGPEATAVAKIDKVGYVGRLPVWDLNTAREHAFFANGVLVHNCIDEIQSLQLDFLPIIHETMSGSPWHITQYTGTPKTTDNPICINFQQSSMAEWVIPCRTSGCHHHNIPSLEYDLLDMMGDCHDDISERRPGVVCAKCRQPISPRWGHWIHRFPDRRWTFAGYHVPQLIMPNHYASPSKWRLLCDKRDGKGNIPPYVFFNECCGESYDHGSKLITVHDLRKASCLPWKNSLDDAKPHRYEYDWRICIVDWGGGGIRRGAKQSDRKKESPGFDYESYTVITVMGAHGNHLDVLYSIRSLHPHDKVLEARLVLGVMTHFECQVLAHDATSGGDAQELILVQSGLPLQRLLPIVFKPPMKGPMFGWVNATIKQPRGKYHMDKTRAVSATCQFIKSGIIRTFQDDYRGEGDPGLLRDFLNLIEERSASRLAGETYMITKTASGPDDFAMTVTMGTMILCSLTRRFPSIAVEESVLATPDLYEAIRNPHPPQD